MVFSFLSFSFFVLLPSMLPLLLLFSLSSSVTDTDAATALLSGFDVVAVVSSAMTTADIAASFIVFLFCYA